MLSGILLKQGTALRCCQLSPSQKKLLWQVMAFYDATPGFSYRRFFKEGFKEWELLGIDKVKSGFMEKHGEISVAMQTRELDFYQAVVACRLRKEFLTYMSALGMGLYQIQEKFGKSHEQAFLGYEMVGVAEIFERFKREVNERQVV